MRSELVKLKAVYWISKFSRPGVIRTGRSIGTGARSTRHDSMNTGGGFGLVASFSGSITATPSCVENHSLPSRVLEPAFAKPPLHSIFRMPSRLPLKTSLDEGLLVVVGTLRLHTRGIAQHYRKSDRDKRRDSSHSLDRLRCLHFAALLL